MDNQAINIVQISP